MRKSKNTISTYIGVGAVKIQPTDQKEFTLAPPDITLTSKAIELLHLFSDTRGVVLYTDALENYQKVHLLTFMKLVQRFQAWKVQGIIIHSINYFLAHLWYFGHTTLQVNQLLSEQGYQIYQAYIRLQKSLQITYTEKEYSAYDTSVVQSLAEVREESVEETRAILTLCGLL